MRLFDSKPTREETLYAEAQALIDDGLDLNFVLELYPDDAEWLAPMLETAIATEETFATAEPSFYFEASLKARFLGAARERHEVVPVSPLGRLRTAIAAGSVMVASGAAGVLTLGFVTAGSAVPGDWNYSFKLANERLQYTLSRGDERVDVQINHTEARVREIQVLSNRGTISVSDLQKLENEAMALRDQLQKADELDAAQRERLASALQRTAAVLADLETRPDVDAAAVATTRKTLDDAAAAAGLGPVSTITPVPTATAEPTATPSPEVTPSPVASETASPTPVLTETPTPGEKPEVTPTPPSATETPAEGSGSGTSGTP